MFLQALDSLMLSDSVSLVCLQPLVCIATEATSLRYVLQQIYRTRTERVRRGFEIVWLLVTNINIREIVRSGFRIVNRMIIETD